MSNDLLSEAMKRSFNSKYQSINSTSTTTKSMNQNNDEKSDENKSSKEESLTQQRNDTKDDVELFDRDQPLAFLSGLSFAKEILQQVF